MKHHQSIFVLTIIFTSFGSAFSAETDVDVEWKVLSTTHGWSINHPAAWAPFVMSSGESNDDPHSADNVNFSGPGGCDESIGRCHLFQMSLEQDMEQSKKYHNLSD